MSGLLNWQDTDGRDHIITYPLVCDYQCLHAFRHYQNLLSPNLEGVAEHAQVVIQPYRACIKLPQFSSLNCEELEWPGTLNFLNIIP